MKKCSPHAGFFPLYLKSTMPVKDPVSVREGFWPTWSQWETRKWATGLKPQKKVKRITQDFNKLYVYVGLAHNDMCDVKRTIFYPAVIWTALMILGQSGLRFGMSSLVALQSQCQESFHSGSVLAQIFLQKSPCRGCLETPIPTSVPRLSWSNSLCQSDPCRHCWRNSIQKWEIPTTV